MLCSVCGVTPFYVPRSNPDGYGINMWCINRSSVEDIEIVHYDGENWEAAYASSEVSRESKDEW